MSGLTLKEVPYPEKADPMDLVEAWEIGKLKKDVFIAEKRYQRSFQYPAIIDSLSVPADQVPDVLVTDAAGIRRVYRWKPDQMENTVQYSPK